jgi:hypothetical protein
MSDAPDTLAPSPEASRREGELERTLGSSRPGKNFTEKSRCRRAVFALLPASCFPNTFCRTVREPTDEEIEELKRDAKK